MMRITTIKLSMTIAVMLAVSTIMPRHLAAQDQTDVSVRSAEHPGYSRIVFDFTTNVLYSVSEEDGRVVVRFSGRPGLVLSGYERVSLARFGNARGGPTASGYEVSFSMVPGSVLRDFRVGTRIVVDALGEDAVGLTTTVVAAPAGREIIVQEGDTVFGIARREGVLPQDLIDANGLEPPYALQPGQTLIIPGGARIAPEPADAGTETAEVVVTPEDTVGGTDTLPSTELVVTSTKTDANTTLNFQWPEPATAAVFARAGYLWVIFEKPMIAVHQGGAEFNGDRVLSHEQIDDSAATILRYRMRSGQFLKAEHVGDLWTVILQDTPTAPLLPFDVLREHTLEGETRVLLPIDEAATRVAFDDPAVGDRIVAITIGTPGRAVDEARGFVEFEVLASAQGVAVIPLSDQVVVRREFNGVVIASDSGLALSDTSPAALFLGDGTPEVVLQEPLDFNRWDGGGPGRFVDNRFRMQTALSRAAIGNRNAARWALARFYLANQMPAASLAALRLMLEEDQDIIDSDDYRAVRGVALHLMERYDEAVADLERTNSNADPWVGLWRTANREARGQHENSLAAYELGRDVVSRYPDRVRANMHLTVARASIETGDYSLAEAELSLLSSLGLTSRQLAESTYLLGRIAEKKGDIGHAIAEYQDSEIIGDRRTRAHAAFAQIRINHEQNTITRLEAIEALEKLQFAWRGDDFELQMLMMVGELYMAEGDYRSGLSILRSAASIFPNSEKTRDIVRRMENAFRHIFLEGEADNMPAISALGLYREFRELTPLGNDGNTLVRRLVDRLVSVDLLEQAAQLLEHQVSDILEGTAQALIAARLAMIYVMDRKPEQAIGILRATRQPIMPDDVLARRNRVEARALVLQSKYEEAEVLIDPDATPEADRLRDDIFWGSEDWARYVAHADRHLATRWQDQQALGVSERQTVIRQAIARSMLDDNAGLSQMRRRYSDLMKGGTFASAFDMLTDMAAPIPASSSAISRNLAAVSTLQSFMTAYKLEFKGS